MELFRLRSGEGTAPYMVLSNIVPLFPFRQINPNFHASGFNRIRSPAHVSCKLSHSRRL